MWTRNILTWLTVGVLGLTALSTSSNPPVRSTDPAPTKATFIQEAYGKLPLSFEANQGQSDGQVKFLSRGAGYSLFLTPQEVVLALRTPQEKSQDKTRGLDAKQKTPDETRTAVLRMQLIGANPSPRITGEGELAGKSNYLRGKDPKQWHTNIPHYNKVRYRDIYPGIDLVYYGNQRQLEYDFVLAPGADPSAIRLKFTGAEQLRLDDSGNLVLAVNGGQLIQHAPKVYQDIEGTRQLIPARYVLKGNTATFAVAAFDAARPLIIDPVLVYSTYLGGSGGEIGWDIAVDSVGNAYVTGETGSPDFPTANALQPAFGGGDVDVFVAKLNAQGSALVYSTFLGGSTRDVGLGIAVDAAGSAYVTGPTGSPDFPTVNALQPASAGGRDAFVAKLNAQGSALVYSTYLGGSGYDGASGIAVDGAGSAYVTGSTTSPDFPTQNALQPVFAGGHYDAFVAKLNPPGCTTAVPRSPTAVPSAGGRNNAGQLGNGNLTNSSIPVPVSGIDVASTTNSSGEP